MGRDDVTLEHSGYRVQDLTKRNLKTRTFRCGSCGDGEITLESKLSRLPPRECPSCGNRAPFEEVVDAREGV